MSVLLLSGGVDSLVLLAQECSEGSPPLCVSFDYGQRHRKELNAALAIAQHYGAHRIVAKLPHLGGSALTDDSGSIPQGKRWDDPQQAATVVPNRNLILLSVAASYAVKHGKGMVLFAAHAGDCAQYPDCRPAFVHAADMALRLACGVGVSAPFLTHTKKGIVELGRRLDAPLHLAWSCYVGGAEPCGECGACRERMEAEAC